MSRLYLRVYLALVAVVIAFFASSSLLFFWHGGGRREDALLAAASRLAQLVLPPSDAPEAAQARRVDELAEVLGVGAALFDAEGDRLAEAGRYAPLPDLDRGESHIGRGPHRDALLLKLADGRWLSLRMPPPPHRHGSFFASLALLAVLLALAAWPLARSLARRIEALTARVDAFGSGELSARATVQGKDEVARLAERFNAAAERIEALVSTQRTLLASASHALRSPLARLRVATELLTAAPPPEPERAVALREQLAHEVALLDSAVEELLAVSRLDLGAADHAPVDLLALAAEEGARVGAEVSGAPTTVVGDARSLRHLLRNLLENAKRHAGDGIEVAVTPFEGGEGARITVADRGPGIPDAERERIFEPFVTGRGGEGVGLGLAIVRQIARHHGGEAHAHPREGGGTCFEVTIGAS
ncbi:MAG: HAMP domain-containing sensor histidine kinase [Myxococcota bacterium]